jgi:hypothetical protein
VGVNGGGNRYRLAGVVEVGRSSNLRLDTSKRFVGRQFELSDFRVRQTSNSVAQARLRNGPHLKDQRD